MSDTGIVHAVTEIDTMRAALQEIKRLHAVSLVWESTIGEERKLKSVCVLCCLDTGGYRTDECEDSHEHTADGPVCSTTEIIARAGL